MSNPPDTHVGVRIRRLEMLVFRKILRTYLMDDPLGAVHMRIVFPLFAWLTWKKDIFLAFTYEMFPRLGEMYFGGLVGGKILREVNIKNEFHWLQEKLHSFGVFEHTRVRYSYFMYGWSSTSIIDSKTIDIYIRRDKVCVIFLKLFTNFPYS